MVVKGKRGRSREGAEMGMRGNTTGDK